MMNESYHNTRVKQVASEKILKKVGKKFFSFG